VPNGATTGPHAVPVDWDAFDRDARPKLRARFSYALGYGIDPDDIVQESLIAAHEHFAVLAAFDSMVAWCTQNGIWRISRARTRRSGRYERPHDNPEAVARTGQHIGGPEELAVENADTERVLAGLSAADQEVLRLHFADLTPTEIGDVLGVSGPVARQRLRRARARYADAAGDLRGRALPLPLWLRRRLPTPNYPDLSAPVSPTMAVSVALSVVAAFTVPTARAAATPSDVRVPSRAPDRARAEHEPRTAVGPGPVYPRTPTARDAAGSGAVASDPGPAGTPGASLPVSVPTPAPTCIGVCVGKRRGDQISVKALGPDSPTVSQYVTPVCQETPQNDVIDCRPGQDPDAWIVKDVPPSPSPSGGT
jgi:RNA polymerase sigma factor (sigma-70 family)